MGSVGILPIVRRSEVDPDRRPPWVVEVGPDAICVPGRKLDVDSTVVGRELDAIAAIQLRTIEEAWIDMLQLPALLAPSPTYPPSGPGGTYARWSGTYYALRRTQGQQKFYVSCTPDHISATSPAATLVRITSTLRGRELPEVA